jgi:hypothetical protein
MKSQAISFAAPPWRKVMRGAVPSIVQADVLDLEINLRAVGEAACDQVLDDFLLAVDRDALAHELAKVEVMQRAIEAEENTVMEHRLALQALAYARFDQEIGRPLLEHARAHPLLHVGAAAVLQHDRVNPAAMQQMREHQPGGAGAYDADLGAHRFSHKGSDNQPWRAAEGTETGKAGTFGAAAFGTCGCSAWLGLRPMRRNA